MMIWFETHATSIDNERGLASGHLDAPLSDAGREQAKLLGQRYRNHPLSAVYTSDLVRASETAAIAFADRAVPVVADVRLRECDYGELSRSSAEKLGAARLRFVDDQFPGGESYRDVVRRMESFLSALPHAEEPVLLIGHRATWYALEHLLQHRDLREAISAPWNWQPGWSYSY